MAYPIKSPRKLIEVALPLDAINKAAKEEKAVPRHGHPQTLHYWWARRPLAAARAVIFAQLVNDPGYQQGSGFKYGKNKKEAAIERKRLFKIIEDIVLWENTNNEEVMERARVEIVRSWREVCELNRDHPQASQLFDPEKLPVLKDPFSGGGTIPLEALRLGLEADASDLNPVAVLINKAMIEIPPMFAGHAPVGPLSPDEKNSRFDLPKVWPGATGLAEDVRRYGTWIHAEAQKRMGRFYPPVEITTAMTHERPDLKPLVGQKLTSIAWLWARTIKSPNPAFSHVDVPLVSTFILSSKVRKEAYVHPVLQGDGYRFTVKMGTPPPEANRGTMAGKRAAFNCLMSTTPIDYKYIREEGKAGRMGKKLMAIVAEGMHGRVYLSPTEDQEAIARMTPTWQPDVEIVPGMSERVVGYGLSTYAQLFTPRQLVAMATFSDLIVEVRKNIHNDAVAAGLSSASTSLDFGGVGALAYAEAVSIYLSCALSRLVSYNNTLCFWNMKGGSVAFIFARQAFSMSWDFIEVNPLERMSGNWKGGIEWVSDVLEMLPSRVQGHASQLDASLISVPSSKTVISTDPPYFDNIGYADLSDFFYVWLRRSLQSVFPATFATMATPKMEELVAAPHRQGGKLKAETFFLDGMTQAMNRLAENSHPSFPLTIYYAFKQSETSYDGTELPPLRRTHPIGYDLTIGGVKWSDGSLQMNSNERQ